MLFVAEFSILEGTVDNPPGAVRSWVQRPETRSQTDLGNIKAFIAACHGLSPDDNLDPTLGDAMVSGKNPAKGTRLCLETEKITTRGGFDYTVHQWTVAAPAVAAAAAAPTGVAKAPPPPPPAPVAELTEARWLAGEGTGAPAPDRPGLGVLPGSQDMGLPAGG